MSVRLAICVVALLLVATSAVAIVMVESSPLGWTVLALGLFPVLAAVLMMTRRRYAEGFLRLTAMVWIPFGLVALLPILLGLAVEPLPPWAVPIIAIALFAGLASFVALVTGIRFLREGP